MTLTVRGWVVLFLACLPVAYLAGAVGFRLYCEALMWAYSHR